MDSQKMGRSLFNARMRKKLTRIQVADMVGLSEATISDWERGKNLSDWTILKKLADILDISIENDHKSDQILERNLFKYCRRIFSLKELFLNMTNCISDINLRKKPISLLSLIFFSIGFSFISVKIIFFRQENGSGIFSVFYLLGIYFVVASLVLKGFDILNMRGVKVVNLPPSALFTPTSIINSVSIMLLILGIIEVVSSLVLFFILNNGG